MTKIKEYIQQIEKEIEELNRKLENTNNDSIIRILQSQLFKDSNKLQTANDIMKMVGEEIDKLSIEQKKECPVIILEGTEFLFTKELKLNLEVEE